MDLGTGHTYPFAILLFVLRWVFGVFEFSVATRSVLMRAKSVQIRSHIECGPLGLLTSLPEPILASSPKVSPLGLDEEIREITAKTTTTKHCRVDSS
jgi:hypothetical protein